MGPVPYDRPQAQSAAEITYMKSVFNDLQSLSIAQDLEYCGYLFLDASGGFAVTERRKGKEGTCRPNPPENDAAEIASFHTHGAYSDAYDSEYPSEDDIRADTYEGNDGYVATPGGRVWYINGEDSTVSLLCGEGCVAADSAYTSDGVQPEIGRRYNFDELDALFTGETD